MMNQLRLLVFSTVFLLSPLYASPVAAQLGSVPTVFTSGTTIRSAEMNALFSDIYSKAVLRSGGTLTGTLTTLTLLPTTDNASDIGSAALSYNDAWFDGTVTVASLSVSTLTCTGCVSNTQVSAGAGIVITKLATFTSAELATQLTNESGTGVVAFTISPTFTTPTLGAATATTLDTGQGVNELYDMNQNVETTSTVTFGNELSITDAVMLRHASGSNNYFFGPSGNNTASGSGNVGVGSSGSFFALTTGANNVALGESTLELLTTGSENVAVGAAALSQLVTGSANVAVGTNAQWQALGSANTAVGNYVMFSPFTSAATDNVAIGAEALYGNIQTNQASAAGTPYDNPTYWTVTAGWAATSTTFSHTADGTTTVSGPGTIQYGGGAVYRIQYTITNYTAGTVTVGWDDQTDTPRSANGTYTWDVTAANVAASVPRGLIVITPSNTARFTISGLSIVNIDTISAARNAVVGTGALYMATSAADNALMGNGAMARATTGSSNAALGNGALFSASTASYNTVAGYLAGYYNVTGNRNVMLGYAAGFYETGSDKFFVDNRTRSDEADGRAKALLYGVFNSATASQSLTVNGALTVLHGLGWGGGSVLGSSNAVAVLADNETVTGTYTFTPAPTFTNGINAGALVGGYGNRVYSDGNYLYFGMPTVGFYLLDSTGSGKFLVEADGDTVASGTMTWGGGSAISNSSNVALLNAAIVNTAAGGSTFTTDLKVLGAEAGDTTLFLWADEGDDANDKAFLNMAASSGDFTLSVAGMTIFTSNPNSIVINSFATNVKAPEVIAGTGFRVGATLGTAGCTGAPTASTGGINTTCVEPAAYGDWVLSLAPVQTTLQDLRAEIADLRAEIALLRRQ